MTLDGLDRELAARGHGVARVDRKIHDDLLDLAGVGAYRPELRAGSHHQIDVFADHAGEHFQVFGGDVVEIDDARGEHLLAAEGEQLAGQRRGALGGAGDLLRRAAQMRFGAEAFEKKFRVAGDDHQQIVEVVRDAAGEAADGFHLLRLAQLLLERAALGDVFGEEFEDNPFFAAVGDGATGDANDRRAVLAFPFGVQAFERRCRAQIVGEVEPLVGVGIETEDVLADQFVRRKSAPAIREMPD